MKDFDVTFEMGMDASRMKTYRVRANTRKTAIKMAEEKAKKDTFFAQLCSCEEIKSTKEAN